MKKKPVKFRGIDLSHCKRNEYSQYGEDGILENLLPMVGVKRGVCVDIGAWDGVKASNILALVERGFGAVMIEADPKKFAALVQTALKYPSIKPVNAEVTKYNAALLERLFFPTGAAVLNIDIDGDDSGVWRAIGAVAEVAVIEWCDHGIDKAVEVLAVAEDLGYVLAAQTNSNMIFVREGK